VKQYVASWVQKRREALARLLTKQLHHPDDSVRAASASALARIGIGNLPERGKLALHDRDLAVRLAGIELLVAAHLAETQRELTALADDPDPIVAAEAAIAVGGGERATRAIERAASSGEWTIRAGAANLAVRAIWTRSPSCWPAGSPPTPSSPRRACWPTEVTGRRRDLRDRAAGREPRAAGRDRSGRSG